MRHRISGDVLPVLEMNMDPGEVIIAPPGELAWMSPSIRMQTTMLTAGASGFFSAIARAISGGGLMMTEFIADAPGGVAFVPRVPGQIVELDVVQGRGYTVHQSGFLCASQGVQLSTTFQRSLGVGIFGGNGFILQHIGGQCRAFVALGGGVVDYDLAAGNSILVQPGHVGMFEDSVQFDITMVPGIKNKLFGGDGFFLCRLTGPGRVWLQTMPIPQLAAAIAPYLAQNGSSVSFSETNIGTPMSAPSFPAASPFQTAAFDQPTINTATGQPTSDSA